MVDVIQAATHYRAYLKMELAKVEQFLGMAELISKNNKVSFNSISTHSKNSAQAKEEYYVGCDHIDFVK